MKKYFTLFLILCFLLNICGCYTNKMILRENFSTIISDMEKELLIKLRDGKTIVSKEYEHLVVKEPSEFILGKANIFDGNYLKKGIGTVLFKSQIDSIDTNYFVKNEFVCYSEGKQYRFSADNYLYITEETDPGYWVKGKIVESGSNFYGILEPDEISTIDAREINVVNTVFFVSGIVLVSLLIIGAIVLSSNPPLEGFELDL